MATEILIIDDNPDIRNILKDLIFTKEENYQKRYSKTAQEISR